MQNLVTALVQHGAAFHSPAGEGLIRSLEAAVGGPLPPALRDLYAQGNGMSAAGSLPLRWMAGEEILGDLPLLREAGMIDETLLPCWTDDQGNYAAVFISGPLTGRPCFLDHEEVDHTPVYPDLESFHAALLVAAAAGQDWSEMLRSRNDVPSGRSSQDEAELALALRHVEQAAAAKDARKRKSLLFKALELFPVADTERILPYLQDDDMWVQERACQLLARRHYVPAIPALAELARHGRQNARIAAMTALREWDHPEAEAQRNLLLLEIDPNWAIYLKRR